MVAKKHQAFNQNQFQMHKPHFATALIAMLALATTHIFAATPVVSSVTASQRACTKIVDIYYNLADADNHPQTIAVLSGDVGDNVLPGNKK